MFGGQRSHPSTKKRVSPIVVSTGGLARILQGVFGLGSPAAGLADQNVAQFAPRAAQGYYQFYEGDIWTPGTGNWVMDPTHDGPLMTIWGRAFLRVPNGFNPLQTPQVYTQAASALYGVGGQISGQMISGQPLSDNVDYGG
jgi:hypothetical protein